MFGRRILGRLAVRDGKTALRAIWLSCPTVPRASEARLPVPQARIPLTSNANWSRSVTPTFLKIVPMCDFTVRSAMSSS